MRKSPKIVFLVTLPNLINNQSDQTISGMSIYYLKYKGKVTVLSPHPGPNLCSADFDKYIPWSLGLSSPYISIWISILTPWGVCSRSHATWRHGLQSVLTGTHLLLVLDRQCSVKCLPRGHSELTHREGIEHGTWPRSWSRDLHSTAGPTRRIYVPETMFSTVNAITYCKLQSAWICAKWPGIMQLVTLYNLVENRPNQTISLVSIEPFYSKNGQFVR